MFQWLTARRLYKSFGVKGLISLCTLYKPSLCICTVGRSKCPSHSHIYLPLYAGWRESGLNNSPRTVHSVCQRHAYSFPPRPVGSLRGRHGFITKSRQLALIVNYLDTYLSYMRRWLREWRIAMSVSNITVILFAKTGSRILNPPPFQLFGQPIHWVDTTRYLGVTMVQS
jgi:hypothetical protein